MTPVPPPVKSPGVPRDSELDAYDPPGRHDTKEVPVTVGVMRAANRFTRLLILFGGLGGGFGGGWVGMKVMRAEAQTVSDAGVQRAKEVTDAANKVIEQRVVLLETNQKAMAASAERQATDTHELQVDVRALYKAMMTGRPQERLENPPPSRDGGH